MGLFSKEDKTVEVNTDTGKVIYSIDDDGLQDILKFIYEFNHDEEFMTSQGGKGYLNYDERVAFKSAEYLRGIGSTLNDPERINLIAELLVVADSVLSLNVTTRTEDL